MNPSYPSLACPFPAAINPHADTIEYATIAWAQQHELIHGAQEAERARRQQFHMLTARCYPQAPLLTVQWINDWYIWSFLFDDRWCDETEQGRVPEQLAQIQSDWLAMLRGDKPELDDPLSRTFANLTERLHAQASAAWLERFIQHAADHFAGCVWEATNRAQHRIPNLATYLKIRPCSAGTSLILMLSELANQHDLPEELYTHPLMQQLMISARNMIYLSNDVMSLEKELRSGDAHNLAIILRHVQQCSLPEAINRIVALHNAEAQRFQVLADRMLSLTATVDADLQQYIEGLQFAVVGNLDWSRETLRYRPTAMGSADAAEQTLDALWESRSLDIRDGLSQDRAGISNAYDHAI